MLNYILAKWILMVTDRQILYTREMDFNGNRQTNTLYSVTEMDFNGNRQTNTLYSRNGF